MGAALSSKNEKIISFKDLIDRLPDLNKSLKDEIQILRPLLKIKKNLASLRQGMTKVK